MVNKNAFPVCLWIFFTGSLVLFGANLNAQCSSAINPASASICPNQSVILSATVMGTGYIWSTGETTSSISVNTVGFYQLTITGPDGCSGNVQVTEKQIPPPFISVSTLTCSTELSVNSTFYSSYQWSTGENTALITVLNSGTYTVTVTDMDGCTNSHNETVEVPGPIANITSSGGLICNGGSEVLTASGGGTYVWSTGATTSSISVTIAQTYTVTVTDGMGCTSTDTYTPPAVNSITPSISSSGSICNGGTQTLTASGGTNYAWSTGASTTSIGVMVPQTYTVTVSDVVGCSSVAMFAVTDSACNNIPTMGEWGLLILSVLMAVVGVAYLRLPEIEPE